MNRLVATLFAMALGPSLGLHASGVSDSPNLFQIGDLEKPESYFEEANPWGGVDDHGNIRGLLANQTGINDVGAVSPMQMSPSVALGDLNGDGLVDLVLADPKGFFWFYPNSGTKQEPKFTGGEVMPIWLADDIDSPDSVTDTVPRIQLVDLDQSKKLSIVAGNYEGKFYYVPNLGSASSPRLETPTDLRKLAPIYTRRDKKLDCNYFSPFLCDWFQDGILHLLRGDGTYSANSIFLFRNKGTNLDPSFNEANQIKVIPGMGREYLTPLAVDWNKDGKPDIVTGQRTGQIELFLNTGTDQAAPTFDEGQLIKIGGQDKFGGFTTVAMGNLGGNPDVPDLVFANDTNSVFLARNTGTPGHPRFDTPPEPIKGTNPFPSILVSKTWTFGTPTESLRGWNEGTPYGVPYELLVVTNARKEPGFAPPPGVNWKNALRYELLEHKNPTFPVSYYPKYEEPKIPNGQNQKHALIALSTIPLDSGENYEFSFWIKGNGVRDFKCHVQAEQGDPDRAVRGVQFQLMDDRAIDFTEAWSKQTYNLSYRPAFHVPKVTLPFQVYFSFYGQGNVYLSGFEIHKK